MSARLWLNISTSAAWGRPPVGIVRVELSLRDALADLLGAGFATCQWDGNGFAAADGSAPLPGDVLITLGLDWDRPYPSWYAWAARRGVPLITCSYDLIPILYPQFCVPEVAARFREYLNLMLWAAGGVLCISQRTRDDLADFAARLGAPLPPTRVIALGDTLPAAGSEIAPEVATLLQRPFVLYVSTIEARKNHEVLVRAWQLLLRRGEAERLPRLVMVGMPGWHTGDLLHEIAHDPQLKDLVVQLNHVDDAGLAALYGHARFCVYPSHYEGWGLPVGEALSFGRAVLASDGGALPEVGGDLVRYLPAWDVAAWADAVLEWSTDPAKLRAAEARVRAGYVPRRWDGAAHEVAALAQELQQGARAAVRTFYPGEAFPYEAGLPVGAALRSTTEEGRLIAAAPLALPAGAWRFSLFDEPQRRAPGSLHLQLRDDDAIIMSADVALAGSEDTALFEQEFTLANASATLSLDASLDSGAVELTRLVLSPAAAAAPPVREAQEPPSGTLAVRQSKRQLFVDVSTLVRIDLKSGIQRVVRSVLAELLAQAPAGFEVLPVCVVEGRGYCLAAGFNGANQDTLDLANAAPLDARAGDVFLGLDLLPDEAPRQLEFYRQLRLLGVAVHFVAYDILPLQMPAHFPPATQEVFPRWLDAVAQADGIVAISRAVAGELRARLPAAAFARPQPLKLGYFHLGADLAASLPTRGLPADAAATLEALSTRPSFLMVGTLEPRKGHAQVVEAFERLWDAGVQANLVIVGKRGWRTAALARSMARNPELGQRLFWFESASDEFLDLLYARCRCLLAASEGEGFGLPLVEAARHGIPILARDLPVFREVAGTHAHYFKAADANALAAAVRAWLALDLAGQAPASRGMPYLDWRASTAQLMNVILNGEWLDD